MSKLLYFIGTGIDELLMVVPDDHDEEFAETTAAEFIDSPVLANEFELDEDYGLSHYRPYVG